MQQTQCAFNSFILKTYFWQSFSQTGTKRKNKGHREPCCHSSQVSSLKTRHYPFELMRNSRNRFCINTSRYTKTINRIIKLFECWCNEMCVCVLCKFVSWLIFNFNENALILIVSYTSRFWHKKTQVLTNGTSSTIILFHLTATLARDWYPAGWLEVSCDAAALAGSPGLLKAVLRTGTNVMLQLI